MSDNSKLLGMEYAAVSKVHIATFVALLFHVCGCIGIFTGKADFFIQASALNQWLMFALLVITQQNKNAPFFLFLLITFVVGMGSEIIGVHTGYLFGDYKYGTVLGKKIFSVPVIIGINWIIIVYCTGTVMEIFYSWAQSQLAASGAKLSPRLGVLSVVVDGALLATFFDFIMEPVAARLGYWQWLGDGAAPILNYVSWFVFSAGFLYVFKLLRFEKRNQFAVHLFIIEILFFGTLRTFL